MAPVIQLLLFVEVATTSIKQDESLRVAALPSLWAWDNSRTGGDRPL